MYAGGSWTELLKINFSNQKNWIFQAKTHIPLHWLWSRVATRGYLHSIDIYVMCTWEQVIEFSMTCFFSFSPSMWTIPSHYTIFITACNRHMLFLKASALFRFVCLFIHSFGFFTSSSFVVVASVEQTTTIEINPIDKWPV